MAARQIILQDCAADGVITVRMEQSGKLSRGVYKLRCGRSDEVEDISANTLVLQKRPSLDGRVPLNLPAFHAMASSRPRCLPRDRGEAGLHRPA